MSESNPSSPLFTFVLCSWKPTLSPLSHITDIIELILDPASYVVHSITPEDLITSPWKKYTTILFVDTIEQTRIHLFLEQLHTYQDKYNGNVIVLDTNFNEVYTKETHKFVCSGEYNDFFEIFSVRNGRAILFKDDSFSLLANFQQMFSKNLKIFRFILGQCGIQTLSEPIPIPKITFGYMLMKNHIEKRMLIKRILTKYIPKTFSNKDLKIDFVSQAACSSDMKVASLNYFPIFTDRLPPCHLFDIEKYFEHLKTKKLGENIIYTEVTTSTIDILSPKFVFSVPDDISLLVICTIQTKGKGRGSNQWASPTGCLMFSQLLTIDASTFVGKHITLLQHIVSIAIVHSIRSIDEYRTLELCLKWPNDIYYKSEHKMGGVLVNNFSMGAINRCILSVGLNVSTQNIFSLNSAIDIFNKENGVSLPFLSSEFLLARTLNFLEAFIYDINQGKLSEVLELYYKYWLHSNVEITSWKNPNERYVIEGLDEYGFLSVTSKIDGRKSTIQPDGNSFDMLNGYISEK